MLVGSVAPIYVQYVRGTCANCECLSNLCDNVKEVYLVKIHYLRSHLYSIVFMCMVRMIPVQLYVQPALQWIYIGLQTYMLSTGGALILQRYSGDRKFATLYYRYVVIKKIKI